MTMSDSHTRSPLVDAAIRRGTLISLNSGESARVLLEEGAPETIDCDVLHASSAPPGLVPGDVVLVWRPAPGERGVLVGRVGPTSAADSIRSGDGPDQLSLEAKQSLTLRARCGSISIRAVRQTLIKGQ